MIRLGQNLRLTAKERRKYALLTGESPEGVRTVDGLRHYLDWHQRQYSGDTPEETLLRHLVQLELNELS